MSENLFSKFLLIFFTTASLGTSAFAGAKVVSQLQPEPVRATAPATIDNVSPTSSPTDPSPSPVPAAPSSSPAPTRKVTASPSPVSPVSISAGQSLAAAPASNPNACIVTLFGKQYDVAPLKTGHPGGDVFVCNTDQTALYQSTHGTNVSRMAPYLLSSSTPNPTGTPTSTPAYRPVSDDDHSEDEDLEEAEDHELEDEEDNHAESEDDDDQSSDHE